MGFNEKHESQYFLADFDRYEDYLDTFVTSSDLRFLRNSRVCRELVILGYRGTSEVFTAKQFKIQRDLIREQINPTKRKAVLFSENINTLDPVILELAAREKPNYQKILSTIVFLTHRTKDGFEVSGFIDFDASLAQANLRLPGHTDWVAVFNEKIKLRPRPRDLSYFDVHKGVVQHNDSDNYIVGHDVKHGLNFMHRGDHKKIFVDNTQFKTEQNYLRSVVFSPKYGYAVFFDHIVRKKI